MWKHSCNKRKEARNKILISYNLLDNNVEKSEFLYKVYCSNNNIAFKEGDFTGTVIQKDRILQSLGGNDFCFCKQFRLWINRSTGKHHASCDSPLIVTDASNSHTQYPSSSISTNTQNDSSLISSADENYADKSTHTRPKEISTEGTKPTNLGRYYRKICDGNLSRKVW